MNGRKFKSYVNQLKVEGLLLVSQSDDAKFIQKVPSLTLCLMGFLRLSPSFPTTNRAGRLPGE